MSTEVNYRQRVRLQLNGEFDNHDFLTNDVVQALPRNPVQGPVFVACKNIPWGVTRQVPYLMEEFRQRKRADFLVGSGPSGDLDECIPLLNWSALDLLASGDGGRVLVTIDCVINLDHRAPERPLIISTGIEIYRYVVCADYVDLSAITGESDWSVPITNHPLTYRFPIRG